MGVGRIELSGDAVDAAANWVDGGVAGDDVCGDGCGAADADRVQAV